MKEGKKNKKKAITHSLQITGQVEESLFIRNASRRRFCGGRVQITTKINKLGIFSPHSTKMGDWFFISTHSLLALDSHRNMKRFRARNWPASKSTNYPQRTPASVCKTTSRLLVPHTHTHRHLPSTFRATNPIHTPQTFVTLSYLLLLLLVL